MARFTFRASVAAVLLSVTWNANLHAQETAGKHALLVGVSNYPHLDARYHLKGPANDVVLMRDCLMQQFGFAADRIITLSEAEGKKQNDRYPERANIEREFKRLAEVAKPGDQVVILMGGHGSQQPEKEDAKDPEPDGLDEIFLPRDVKSWDGDQGKVPNAIIDDEIGAWIAAIRAKQAYVWIIFDSCHSGTMLRGAGETARQIHDDSLGIPKDAIRKAVARAAKRQPEGTRGGPTAGEPQRTDITKSGGVVALYACQSNEVTVERDLPLQSEEAKPYGLLTFTLVQTLTQSKRNSGKVPTYRELIQIVHSRYAAMGRTAPTPQMEGPVEDRQRDVLGIATWPGKSLILLTSSDSAWKINAGTLHGITPGSILAVRPLADQKDPEKIVGHVRVEKTKMTTAEVVPCEFRQAPANPALPEEGRCEVVHLDVGSRAITFALEPNAAQAERLKELRAALDMELRRRKSSAAVRLVDDVAAADWIIRSDAFAVRLIPSIEFVKDKEVAGSAFGPFGWNQGLMNILLERFDRIARTENLRRLAGNLASESTRSKSDESVKLDINIRKMASEEDRKGTPLPLDESRLKLQHDDIISLSLSNPNRFSMDVTVLYVDSAFGIEAIFPDRERGESNRLAAGETIPVQMFRLDSSKTFGPENLLVIAVKSTAGRRDEIDFSFLAQKSIETVKRSGPSTPLDELFAAQVFGIGTSRGISRRAVDDFAFRMIPWHLSPEVQKRKK